MWVLEDEVFSCLTASERHKMEPQNFFWPQHSEQNVTYFFWRGRVKSNQGEEMTKKCEDVLT